MTRVAREWQIPPVDLALARRLERAEAVANAALVEARALLEPSVGAAWTDVAGVFAMFDGIGSPLTQTFGLGLWEPFLDAEFARVEGFFGARGSSTSHEASSFAPDATLRLLSDRGYVPSERSTVWLRQTTRAEVVRAHEVSVRPIAATEGEQWARTSALGWSDANENLRGFVEQLGRVVARARGAHCFVAEVDGQPIATATLSLTADVALLAGASTVPTARGRGAQLALLQARLAYAAARGIDFAMVVTQPDGASRRNAERQGFRPVYTRTKWQRSLRVG